LIGPNAAIRGENLAAGARGGGKIVFFGKEARRGCATSRGGTGGAVRTERPGLAAWRSLQILVLTNPAGNDYGFEHIFSRQIESLVVETRRSWALTTKRK